MLAVPVHTLVWHAEVTKLFSEARRIGRHQHEVSTNPENRELPGNLGTSEEVRELSENSLKMSLGNGN